ncbi:polyisoprenoid-binding protein [Steroidobacter agaridevorans]|uniref:Polyisoprenoid-binding protein n=1 Tax=Steroidobacter agaridevorans TaxID=2695856 RepID=A0A829YBU8_9GAMM|nr:YceI family protein [Steroidobacter agaridevorans]GFE80757.1 polyisoprenoid-binding protein [Steroidobacter agaridevorans]
MKSSSLLALAVAAAALTAGAVSAAPVKYNIDPNHTYPSFTADHMGGLSNWRGKINSSSGTVTLDKEAQSGTVDVKMDMSAIDFGHEKMNTHAKSAEIFNVEQFPNATYTGKLVNFKNGAPTEIDGSLTLHGVTKPVKLKINSFLCKPNPMNKKETCGADASGKIDREEFGVDYGKGYGFKQEVELQIQVEAVKAD